MRSQKHARNTQTWPQTLALTSYSKQKAEWGLSTLEKTSTLSAGQ